MQIDTWLTDTSYPDRCPLCSQPLAAGSNTCPSCGFTAHEPVEKAFSPVRPSISRSANPLTPIPARASARRTQSRPGGGTNRGKGVAPAARASAQTAPQGEGWQHESPSYEAVSSLSALSLIISETPTAPPRTPRSTGQLEHIDEIDTVPESSGRTQAVQRVSDKVQAIVPVTPEIPSGAYPLRLEDLVTPDTAQKFAETHLTPPFSHIDEIDTVPETGSVPSGALVPSGSREVAVDASSWTAGPGSTSLAAHFIASRSPRRRKRKSAFNPVDRTRWWLLRPGHMEFALWTVGSILLFGITFLLLLATVLSLIVPGLGLGGKFSTSSATPVVMTPARTSALTSSLHLTLQGTTSVSPGAELHLQGSGFHPRSKVVFLLDGHLPLLDQQGRTASTQANSAGSFEVKVWLGQGAAWSAGPHQIFAREPVSSHQAVLTITILSVSAPVLPGTTGGQNPPVASVSPTPTPEQPDPTPGQPTATATTPEPTPTDQPPGSTPTAASSPSPQPTHFAPTAPVVTAAPGHGTPAGSSALGNDVNTTDDSSLMTRLLHLNPLVWLIVTCYFVSMVLLGLAGLLRRRRQ